MKKRLARFKSSRPDQGQSLLNILYKEHVITLEIRIKIGTTATVLQRQQNRVGMMRCSEQHNGFLSTQRTPTHASGRPRPNPSLGTSTGTAGSRQVSGH